MPSIQNIKDVVENLTSLTNNPHSRQELGQAFLRDIELSHYGDIKPFWEALKPLCPDEKSALPQPVSIDDVIKKINAYFDRHLKTFDRDSYLAWKLSAFFSVHRAYLYKLHRGLQLKLTIIDPWDDIAAVAASNVQQLDFHPRHNETAWFYLNNHWQEKADALPRFNVDILLQHCMKALKENRAHETTFQFLQLFHTAIPVAQAHEIIAMLISYLDSGTWREKTAAERHNARLCEVIKGLLTRLPLEQRVLSLDPLIAGLDKYNDALLPILRQFEASLSQPQCTQILTTMLVKGQARRILPFKRGLTADLCQWIRTELGAIHQRQQDNQREPFPFCPHSRYIYLSRFLPTEEQQAEAITANVRNYATIMIEKSIKDISHQLRHQHRAGSWISPEAALGQNLPHWINCVAVQDTIPETTQAGLIAGLLNLLPPAMVNNISTEHALVCLALVYFREFFPLGDFDSTAHALTIAGKPFADKAPQAGTIDIEQKKQLIYQHLLRYLEQDPRKISRVNDFHYIHEKSRSLHANALVKAILETFHADNAFIPDNMRPVIKHTLVNVLMSPNNLEQETAAHALLSWVDRMDREERTGLLLDLTAHKDNENYMNVHQALVFLAVYHRHCQDVATLSQEVAAQWDRPDEALANRYATENKDETARLHHAAAFCQSLFKRRKPMAELVKMKEEKAAALERLEAHDACNECKEPLLTMLSQIKEKIMDDKFGEADVLLAGLFRSSQREQLAIRDNINVPGKVDRVRYQLDPPLSVNKNRPG